MTGGWTNLLVGVFCLVVFLACVIPDNGDAYWVPGLLSAVGLVSAVVLGVFCLIAPQVERNRCEQLSTAVDRETRFVRLAYVSWECFVETDDGFIPVDNWRSDDAGR